MDNIIRHRITQCSNIPKRIGNSFMDKRLFTKNTIDSKNKSKEKLNDFTSKTNEDIVDKSNKIFKKLNEDNLTTSKKTEENKNNLFDIHDIIKQNDSNNFISIKEKNEDKRSDSK